MDTSTPEKVAEMYDSAQVQEGKIILEGQYHWGYWDDKNPEASLGEAADRLTQIMIDKSTIQEGERFCDLGCGVGVPAMRIAKTKGCFVDAVTISKSQYKEGKQHVEEAGMSDQVRLILGNVLEMSCDDATYHGGWFFESIFHMGHRKALQEASRILKPGATLLIADLSMLPTITEEFKTLAKEYTYSVFISKEDYLGLLDEAGFDLIEIDDVTEFVMTPLVPKIKAAFKHYESELSQSVISSEYRENLFQMYQDMCDNLGYILVKAQKRA
ncbi:MAG: methyltransferase domain-containing protein [Moorea sp. SIO3I7]|nr:methyltransferase domain-containing protein [Moorena sp. SIO3I7]